MGVIDTFFYVFKADDKQLQQTQKTAEAATKKTTDALNQQDAVSKRLAKAFDDLKGAVLGVVGAYAGWAALKATSIVAADDTNKLAAQARALRMSADTLAVWQQANARAGGSAEAMTATLQGLLEKTRDPILALERIADRFKGVSDRQADRMGAQLGLDAGTVEMMRQGHEGLRKHIELQFKLGEVTKEQIAVAAKWKLAQSDLNVMGDDLRRRIMVQLLPAFTKVVEGVQKIIFWVRENSRFLENAIPAAAIVAMIAFRGQIAALALGFIKLTAAMLTNPLVLMVAGVLALGAVIGLVIDDLLAWREGGNSMFGMWIEKWPSLKAIGEFILKMYDGLLGGFDTLRDGVKSGLKEMGEAWDRYAGYVKDAWELIKPIWEGMKTGATIVSKFLGPGVDHAGALAKEDAAHATTVPQEPLPFTPAPVAKAAYSATPETVAIAPQVPQRKTAWALPPQDAPSPPAQLAKTVQQPPTVTAPPTVVNLQAAKVEVQQPPTRIIRATKAVEPTAQETTAKTVKAAQAAVVAANTHPMTSTTSNAISNSALTTNNKNSTKTTNVTVGKVEVITQATDGEGIAKTVGSSLQAQIKQANDEVSNGIAI